MNRLAKAARRRLLALLAVLPLGAIAEDQPSSRAKPERRWYEAAAGMRHLALSWNDQPYGAVLVRGGVLVGEGPSRVVRNGDESAHAEREAIRDAQRKLGTAGVAGAILYSTSRPCPLCEDAAAIAGVSRMYFGPELVDAGAPRRLATHR